MKNIKTKNSDQGFTIIELLIVIAVVAILATIIYVGAAKQRENAKVNAALQTAANSQSIGRECFFRLRTINQPNDPKNPTNEICASSQTVWPPVNTPECQYAETDPYDGTKYNSYIINCDDLGKRIVCGVTAENIGCEIEDIP